MIKKLAGMVCIALATASFNAQENHHEDDNLPLKLHHAEPIYIDLMRDLGARKGEKEWNIGMGINDNNGYYELSPFIEYEWAVADRLGLEVELPFNIYTSAEKLPYKSPGTRLSGIKLAAQYTFLVNKEHYTSMAIGYMNEIELNAFRDLGKKFFTGNIYNPFFVVAKGWGKSHHFNTLIYAGPQFVHHFSHDGHKGHLETDWQINTNFHYVIPNTSNFVGLEVNKSITKERFNMVLRPQVRVEISDELLLGLVVGVPTNQKHEGYSGFARLIYLPKDKKKK